MKVAVIIDTWFPAIGGGQINSWEISKRLSNKNLQIDIITRDNGRDNLKQYKYLHIIKLGSKAKPESAPSKIIFSLRLIPFIMNSQYDLIHVHPFLPALFAKIASKVKGIPILITIHGTKLFENRWQLTPSRILEWFILTMIKYDAVISVTEAFKKIKNVNKNIEVIPNGIDIDKFIKINVKKATYPKILWVGRFDPVKRVDNLILAMKILSKKIPKARLTLVGYGQQEKQLKELTKSNYLKNIDFVGKKIGDDLIREYKSSHVFVLCSSSEGQPITVLEAQAAGLPVVATDVGDLSGMIKNHINGVLTEPDNIKSLSEGIKEALRKHKSMKKQAQEISQQNYTWDKISDETYGLYMRVLSSKN